MSFFDLLKFRSVKGTPLTEDEGDANTLILAQGIVLRGAQLVGQSFAGFARTSTNTTGGATGDNVNLTVASVTMPAGTMGLNSKLVIIPDWDLPNPGTSSTKFLSVNFGGTNISAPSATTSLDGKILIEIQNLNSLFSQKTLNGSSYGLTTNARIATSIDTSQDVAIDFAIKWGAAVATPETVSLLGYSIWHYPGN